MINTKNLCYGCMNEKVGDGKCPICGYQPDEKSDPSYLLPGFILDGRYIIGKIIEINGEGVTYLGFDTVGETTVNVREYFPAGLCRRTDNGVVSVVPGKDEEYNSGIISFIDLSKALFRLNDLPALFNVLDIRETNNTAYRITQALPCISLREFLLRNGGMLNWDQARPLFVPLISTISALHAEGIIHMGISPDTIMVGKDAKLRLSGFCIPAARTAKSPMTAQIFPGFAAIEQYGVVGRPGPWTDIYGYAATLYRTIVGNPPPEAIDRMNDDSMTIPARIARELPKSVLETIADALQILPEDRTGDITLMRKGLAVSAASRTQESGSVSSNREIGAGSKGADTKKKFGKYGIIALCLTLAVILVVIATVIIEINKNNSTSNGSTLGTMSISSNLPAQKSEYDNTKYYTVPNFVGLNYGSVAANVEYNGILKYSIKNKEYSDTVSYGCIISQSIAEGCEVQKETAIEFVVSLGKYTEKIPNVIGMDIKDAKIALYEDGFYNIEIGEIFDESKPLNTVIEVQPSSGSINRDEMITLYVNAYEAEEDEPDTSSTTSKNNSSKTSSTSSGNSSSQQTSLSTSHTGDESSND